MACDGLWGGAVFSVAGPTFVTSTCHAMRSQRRCQARLRHETRITELELQVANQEAELRQWRTWWYGYDADIADRAHAVARSLHIHKKDYMTLGYNVHYAAVVATLVGGDNRTDKLTVHRSAGLAKHTDFVDADAFEFSQNTDLHPTGALCHLHEICPKWPRHDRSQEIH